MNDDFIDGFEKTAISDKAKLGLSMLGLLGLSTGGIYAGDKLIESGEDSLVQKGERGKAYAKGVLGGATRGLSAAAIPAAIPYGLGSEVRAGKLFPLLATIGGLGGAAKIGLEDRENSLNPKNTSSYKRHKSAIGLDKVEE